MSIRKCLFCIAFIFLFFSRLLNGVVVNLFFFKEKKDLSIITQFFAHSYWREDHS